MRNKKAALELSITAIVVLIIAITVLGLGIGFIKNLFQKGTVTIGEQYEAIRERLKEEFLQAGTVVGFSAGTDIEADFGKRKEFFIGIRNTESVTRCYQADVVCKRPFNPELTECGTSPTDESMIWGDYSRWFTVFPPDVEVTGNDLYVAPVTLHITDAPKGTYRLALNLYKSDSCDFIDIHDPSQQIESILLHVTVK